MSENQFTKLDKEARLPSELQSRVANQLAADGQFRKRNGHNRLVWVLYVVLIVVAFSAGMYYESFQPAKSEPMSYQSAYLLLLHEDESFAPVDAQTMREQYGDWARSLYQRNELVTGAELEYTGDWVDPGGLRRPSGCGP